MATIHINTDDEPHVLRAVGEMLVGLATPREASIPLGDVGTLLDHAKRVWHSRPTETAAAVEAGSGSTFEFRGMPEDEDPGPQPYVSPTDDALQAQIDAATTSMTPPTVDAAGLPWDERIHSSSKALLTDGTWRQRRNLAPGLKEQVEAELRERQKAASQTTYVTYEGNAHDSVPTTAPVPGPAAPPPMVAPPEAPAAAEASAPQTPAAPPRPPPVPPVADPVVAAPSLATISAAITNALTAGTFTAADMVAACHAAGATGLPDLAGKTELIPIVAATLGLRL